jgi:hypothetical protein
LSRALEICIASGHSVTALTAAHQPPQRDFIKFCVTLERPVLHERIAARAVAMLDGGWIEEVQRGLDAGAAPHCPGLASLGYPHVIEYLQGRLSRPRLLELVTRDTRASRAPRKHGSASPRRDATPPTFRCRGNVDGVAQRRIRNVKLAATSDGRRDGSS